jgi:hypothetical protein
VRQFVRQLTRRERPDEDRRMRRIPLRVCVGFCAFGLASAAVAAQVPRGSTDPKSMTTLWVQALHSGMGSSRCNSAIYRFHLVGFRCNRPPVRSRFVMPSGTHGTKIEYGYCSGVSESNDFDATIAIIVGTTGKLLFATVNHCRIDPYKATSATVSGFYRVTCPKYTFLR